MFNASGRALGLSSRTRALAASTALGLAATVLVALPGPAAALGPNAVVTDPGCSSNLPAASSDGSVALPFPVTFLGATHTSLWVNTHGNVSFVDMGATQPSTGLPGGAQIIAPFYATVDASPPGSVTYGTISFGGRTAFCVNWLNVASVNGSPGRNSFQLLLVDRSDVNPGNFDAIFNYDQIQWDEASVDFQMHCPDPNDPTNCFPFIFTTYASVGYNSDTPGAVGFELPSSGQQGALLDSNTGSGLVHSSSGSLQLGRYRFEFRGVPNAAVVQGFVKDAGSGAPLAGAPVDLCKPAGCLVTTTSGSGYYSFVGLIGGNYTLTAYPPTGAHVVNRVSVLGVGASEIRNVDLLLDTPAPLPGGSTVSPSSLTSGNVPVVGWNTPLLLSTMACAGGSATWELRKFGVVIAGKSGPMTEGPAGTYKATTPVMTPAHGTNQIVMQVTCPGGTVSTVDFNIYIDPSGEVHDTTGTLLVGATVTLFRSDQAGGPFTQVPNGDAIMSPSNRTNPDLTDSAGHFGWDVIAGYYTVKAQKSGCYAPGNPGQAFVETTVMTIPPPVTNLDLVLECPQATPDFSPLTPARILDTRNGTGGITGKVGSGATVQVPVVGVGGVPSTGVGAVVLNVTVTEPTAVSWVSVYPAGQPLPLASNLNFVPDQDVPNLVVAKVGTNGEVSLHNNTGSTHVVFDVVGWFAAGASSFTALTPSRVLDTRNGTGGISGKVGPGATVQVPVVGVGGVPSNGVGAVVLNVTVTEPTSPSWLAVYPAGQPLPLASNLNFVANQDVPNLVVAKVGANGAVSVHNNVGSTHVVFDVVGWFVAGSTSFTSLTPARILDTRNGTGGITGKVGPGATVQVPVVGVGGVPSTGVGAVVLNVTATEATEPSWLAVYPAGQPLPLASNLNFVANQDVPNLVVAKVGTNGAVSVHNNVGSTHVVFDVVGWFAA